MPKNPLQVHALVDANPPPNTPKDPLRVNVLVDANPENIKDSLKDHLGYIV
jgi:hypothetical protein